MIKICPMWLLLALQRLQSSTQLEVRITYYSAAPVIARQTHAVQDFLVDNTVDDLRGPLELEVSEAVSACWAHHSRILQVTFCSHSLLSCKWLCHGACPRINTSCCSPHAKKAGDLPTLHKHRLSLGMRVLAPGTGQVRAADAGGMRA